MAINAWDSSAYEGFYGPTQNKLHTKGAVTRGNFFLQLATQQRFKLPFTREIASSNTSSLQNNPTAGHTTTCICLQCLQEPEIYFSPKFALQVARKNCLVSHSLNASFP